MLHSTILVVLSLTCADAVSDFVFDSEPTKIALRFSMPANFFAVYGKLEPEESEWMILFEVDRGRIPATYPGIQEDIQAGDEFEPCSEFPNAREASLEAELHPSFVRIRGRNIERYEHPDQIEFGRRFRAQFFMQEENDGPICRLDSSVLAQVRKTNSTDLNPTPFTPSNNLRTQSRRTIATWTPTMATRRYMGNVRFATFKIQKPKPTLRTTSTAEKTYIDIQNDKEVYIEVQRSRTKEINSNWSATFLMFLWLEMGVIGMFVAFGLVMFVVLQIKPSDGAEKFIALVE